jgi:exopolysaccharide biosynthesis polyprenyl glycosylphosphotransferase
VRVDTTEVVTYSTERQLKNVVSRGVLGFLLSFFDFLIAALSLELSTFFRFGSGVFFGVSQISSTPSFYLIASVIIFTYLFEGLYKFKTYMFWDELWKVLKSSFFSLIIIIVISFVTKIYFSRFVIISSVIFFMFFDSVFRYAYRRILFKIGALKTNVLIIGAGRTGGIFLDKIRSHPFTTYNPIGFLDDDLKLKNLFVNKLKVLGKTSEIDDILSKNHVDEIVIALPSSNSKKLSEVITNLEGKVRSIKFIPNMYEIITFSTEIQDMDGLLSISARQNSFNPINRFLKRTFDISIGLIGFAIFILIYISIGVVIKAEDGGPILFKHTRIGKNLKPFKMYKFRTMVPNAESKLKEMLVKDEKLREEFLKNFKLKNDPRITKIGRFLRKTSLDEFPQFINVLKGDMSIVGPRPIVQKEIDMYYGKDVAKRVFSSKPGITGMWQASGRSDIENYNERIDMDIYYVRNQSLWLDFIILFKTIKAVLKKDGAY